MAEKAQDNSSGWVAKDIGAVDETSDAGAKFAERVKLVDDAIALKSTDRVPCIPFAEALPYFLYGSTWKDSMYDYPKAAEAQLKYYEEFQPDASTVVAFTSGKAQELAGSRMIDWPGRPGTKVPDFSTYQVIENEYMSAEEYPELIHDFTGFMLRKYIPRAFPGLKGLAGIGFVPSIVLNTGPLASLYSPDALEAYKVLAEIAAEDAKAAEATNDLGAKIAALGVPPMMTGAGEAPFDIIGDYYRSTLATLLDQMTHEEELIEACDMLADIQIASYAYFDFVPLPCKRVFFPLHKGMDTFMSEEQYAKIYWAPLKKIMMALIDKGVTPYIYTEGPYDTRLEQLADVPKGKVLYHLEKADMKRAKEILGGTACISGNLPINLLMNGTPDQVRDECKRLIDELAPGGGYIFDTNACIDNAKRENVEAMFETVREYGVY